MELKDLIKNRYVYLMGYQNGKLFYEVRCNDADYQRYYSFEVPVNDVGNGFMAPKDKAIYYMRWIRKAIEEGSLALVYQSHVTVTPEEEELLKELE